MNFSCSKSLAEARALILTVPQPLGNNPCAEIHALMQQGININHKTQINIEADYR